MIFFTSVDSSFHSSSFFSVSSVAGSLLWNIRRAAGAVLALCAMGSKETGFLAPVLVAVLVALTSDGGWRERTLAAARRSAV